MIKFKFINPFEDLDGRALLECSFSESHRDEQIITQIAETLNRQNLVRAISELELQLSRKEKEGRVENTEALRELKRCLQKNSDLEVQRLSTINQQNGQREFVRTFRLQFRPKRTPGTEPVSAPTWGKPHRENPDGSVEDRIPTRR